jgi:hypothetical protein
MVNIATDGRAGAWSWFAVGVLTVLTAVATLWLHASTGSAVRDELSSTPAEVASDPATPAKVVHQNAVVTGGSVQQAGGDIVNIDRPGRDGGTT